MEKTIFALGVCVLAGGLALSSQAQAPDYDLLVRNGWILDGTGNPAFRGDLAVRGGAIAAIGRRLDGPARRTIDAAGLHVAPGFIDVHSHADRALVTDALEARRAHNVLSQGITTVLGAPDGRNPLWPFASELAAYERHGVAVNVVPMVGHNSVRRAVMQDDYEREATADEVGAMQALVRDALEAGAWGLGAGLEYRPGRFSTPDEVVALAHVVAEYDGFYYAHLRGAGRLPKWQLPSMVDGWPIDGQEALDETIRIARETGIRVVASHIKAKGRAAWGRAANDVAMANRARQEGLEVYFDQYPYDGHSGSPANLMPMWALVDPGVDASGGLDDPILDQPGVLANRRENLRRTLADPAARERFDTDLEYAIDYNGGPDRIIVTGHPDASLRGRTIAELAAARDTTAADVLIDFALTGDPDIVQGALLRPLSLDEADVELYMQQEYTATSTDGMIGAAPGRHPRSYGAFTRKIARYVRERGAISLPFAIRSSTSLPAQIIGLRDRGRLHEGQAADIVVFDADTVQDRATALEPDRHSEGIAYVLINGELAIDEGRFTDAIAGRVLRRPGDAGGHTATTADAGGRR